MSALITAAVGAAVVGGVASNQAAGKAAGAATNAANAQQFAAMSAQVQQQQQQDQVKALLSPYVQAGVGQFDSASYLRDNPDVAADSYWGAHPYEHYLQHGQAEGRQGNMLSTGSLGAQQDLLGLNGADKQQAAYSSIENSPGFKAMVDQGENAIRQNASATGGLRGGNIQAALAQFRPTMLQQAIDQQYQRLSGLTNIGQNAAAGVGNSGNAAANTISGLITGAGSAQAGAALAQGRAQQNGINGIASAFGTGLAQLPSLVNGNTQGAWNPSYGSNPTAGTPYGGNLALNNNFGGASGGNFGSGAIVF